MISKPSRPIRRDGLAEIPDADRGESVLPSPLDFDDAGRGRICDRVGEDVVEKMIDQGFVALDKYRVPKQIIDGYGQYP